MFAYALSFLVISLNRLSNHRKFFVNTSFDDTLTRGSISGCCS